MGIIWQCTFTDARYPTNNTNNPVGRVNTHWEVSDYFYDDYGGGFNPGIGGSGTEDLVGPYAGDYSLLSGAPDDHLYHDTGDDQIRSEANNPAGGGGKGFRHYRANLGNGDNRCGGGCAINLPAAYGEFWFRLYMRYQLGFTWGPTGVSAPGYTKDIYNTTPSGWAFGIQGGSGSWGIFPGLAAIPSSKTWASTMGGLTGDGLFHLYEGHIKHGAPGVGLVELKVDGALVLSASPSGSESSAGWQSGTTQLMHLGDNQNAIGDSAGLAVDFGGTPTNWYTDYDDIVFSDSGWIGGVGGVAPIPSITPKLNFTLP